MRVITLNVNGLRSATSKGLFRWLAAQRADVVCLQEIKCQELDLDAKLHNLKTFSSCYAFAEKKGYSGVALMSRRQPDEVRRGFASTEFDAEGRYVEARFGNLWVISVYLPSGSAGPHRQASKFRFLKGFLKHLKLLQERGHASAQQAPCRLRSWRTARRFAADRIRHVRDHREVEHERGQLEPGRADVKLVELERDVDRAAQRGEPLCPRAVVPQAVGLDESHARIGRRQ